MYWYLRRQNRVSGPFPLKQLQQSILLGRVGLNDEVSQDKQEWQAIRGVSQLIPEVLSGEQGDPQARERLAAARRWADDRRGERRDVADHARLGPGRREPEAHVDIAHRTHREAVLGEIKNRREKLFGSAVVVIVVLLAGVYAGFYWVPKATPGAQCDAKAAAAVNWNNCQLAGIQQLNTEMQKAQLSGANLQAANLFGSNLQEAHVAYADFSRANLSFVDLQKSNAKGANFSGADLTRANLSHADMSYANFRHAKLTETNLDKTILDHAIWIDGKTCLVKSVGKCVVAN